MHVVRDEKENSVEVESVGRGRIFWIPIQFRRIDRTINGFLSRIRYLGRQGYLLSKHQGERGLSRIISSFHAALNHQGGHFRYNGIVFSDLL
jgi:hypothetical protein